MEFLSATLSRCWGDLEDESRQFLMTGESVFRLFRASGAPDLDYAAVALPLAKSLEVELNTKLLRRFREYLRAQGNLDAAVAEAHSRRIRLALEPSTRSRRALSLGEFARELGQMIHGDGMWMLRSGGTSTSTAGNPASCWTRLSSVERFRSSHNGIGTERPTPNP